MNALTVPTVMFSREEIRDAAAMAALTGILANPDVDPKRTWTDAGAESLCRKAFTIADAFMKLRDANPEGQ